MERYVATQLYKADSPESRILRESGIAPSEFVLAADAQATVEALQRQVMHLDKTLADVYAQRDGLQRERDVLRRQVDTQRRTIQRYQASHDEHTQLQALARALPVYAADALITVDGDLDEIDRPALRSAVMELLEYRATLAATTPAGGGKKQ